MVKNVKIGLPGLNVGHRQQVTTWSTAVTRLYTFTTFLLLSFPCLYSLFLHCDDDENNFTCLLMLHTSLMFLQSSKEMTYSWQRTLRNQIIMDIT